jgi:superfamily II DNA or RNA helicase
LLPEAAQRDKVALGKAVLRMMQDRPRDIFEDAELCKTLTRNLDPGKPHELRFRLGLVDTETTSELRPETLTATQAWPIVLGFFGLDAEEMASAPRSPPRESVLPAFGLFEHQRSIVRRAYSRIGAGSGRTLIHMPTGSGKTRTAIHLVARILNEQHSGVIVWLASSRELLEQAAETFQYAWSALGNRDVQLHRFWGGYDDPPDELKDGLLIGGLAKLHAWRARDGNAFLRLSARTRLVVIDEAHQAIAPTYRAVIDGLADAGQFDAVLGLTATPGRTWNDVAADQRLSEFFSGSKVVLEIDGYANPVAYLLKEGYLATPTFTQIEYPPERSPTASEIKKLARLDDYSDDLLEGFAIDVARNIAIIDAVNMLITGGHRRIILFAVSVRHAEDLAAALSAYGVECHVVSGETPAASRSSILKLFKSPVDRAIVLCNFGVLTTGFDAPRTSAAIIARPTKSLVLFSQMVGRATRGTKAGGNATCEILTVHDPAYPGFGDIAEAFFNWEDVWNDD